MNVMQEIIATRAATAEQKKRNAEIAWHRLVVDVAADNPTAKDRVDEVLLASGKSEADLAEAEQIQRKRVAAAAQIRHAAKLIAGRRAFQTQLEKLEAEKAVFLEKIDPKIAALMDRIFEANQAEMQADVSRQILRNNCIDPDTIATISAKWVEEQQVRENIKALQTHICGCHKFIDENTPQPGIVMGLPIKPPALSPADDHKLDQVRNNLAAFEKEHDEAKKALAKIEADVERLMQKQIDAP